MAASLGGLLVSLGLDAAQFFGPLSKADAQAQRFAQNLQLNVAGAIIKAEVALIALGAAARLARDVFTGLTDGAAKFKGLSEETGASAEALASFALAGAAAGVEVEAIAASMIKLTKSLIDVDDESKAVGAALARIGINVREFKQLDPAEQYEAIGRALSGFADGSGKTAIAVTLLGKAGAAQLKVYQDLEAQGGRTVILTQRQIEIADEFVKKQAIAVATVKLHAQALAADAIPALTAFGEAVVEAAKAALGLDTASGRLQASRAIREWAFGQAEALAELIGKFQSLGALVGAVVASVEAGTALVKNFGPFGPKLSDRLADGTPALAAALDEQKRLFADARKAWESYNNFDEGALARRVRYASQVRTVGSENDPRRGRGFVGPAGDTRPKLPDPAAAGALLRKELDAQLKAVKQFADAQKDTFDYAGRIVGEFYADGLLTLQASTDAQRAVRAAALSSLVASLDQEIAALEAYRRKAAKPEEKVEATTRIGDAQARRTAAIVQAQREESVANLQAARDVRALEQSYQDLVTSVLRLRGDESGAALAGIARQAADARRLVAQRGGDPGVADEFERRLRQSEQLNQAQRDYGRLVERARSDEESIALAAQERGASELQTLQEIRGSRQAALRQLEVMAEAAQRLADASGSPDAVRFAEQLAMQLKRATAEAEPLLLKLRDVGREAGASIAGAFEDAVLSGGKFSDVLKELEKSLLRIAYQQLVTKPFEQYLSGAIGGNGQASGGGGWIGALLGLFGGSGSGGSSAAATFGGVAAGAAIGGMAGGGVARPGSVFEIAENRPEVLDVNGRQFVFMGKQRGVVDPNPRASGGGVAQNITMNFTVSGPSDRRSQGQIGAMAARGLGAAAARNG